MQFAHIIILVLEIVFDNLFFYGYKGSRRYLDTEGRIGIWIILKKLKAKC